jgi:Glycosyl transferases group 1
MKVWFLTRYNEVGASSRCRVYQYLPYLATRGIHAEIAPQMPSAAELWRRAGIVDAVLLQKRVPTLAKTLLLRRRAPVMLFDFDDAIWLRRRRDGTICRASPRTRLRLAAALRLSDRVIAGNEYLAAYARRWNRRVTVLPTPVDGEYYGSGQWIMDSGRSGSPKLATAHYPLATAVRLGWVGHPSNLCYLRRLEPALAALTSRYAGLSLQVVCSEPYESPAIPVENVPWSLADEVANLSGFDIGLMPLDDDPWTRGKCGYKALQYMAAGIPVVCSPVGMNVEIVQEGETGLLAGDLSTWEKQLSRLIESPELRRRLGAAGRHLALRQYSLGAMAPRLADLLWSTVRSREASRARGSEGSSKPLPSASGEAAADIPEDPSAIRDGTSSR